MVYIDSEFKCHTSNPDNIYRQIETDFFNEKSDAFIEGYRFIPVGESWTRSDGEIFHGEMISPWKPYDQLNEIQRSYELELLASYKTEKEELNASYNKGVNSI